MTASSGFWSYAHQDDDAEGGRIADLARDVAAQFEMLTAEPLELFLDRDALEWGDEWRPKIDGSLASIAFFIPILTPRYFARPECRRELNAFARQAEKLGVQDLVMPIVYVDFPALHEDPTTDNTVALAKRFQWVDWTKRKFDDRGSGAYRKEVNRLAERLVRANDAAERATAVGRVLAGVETEDDSELGSLDKLAQMEEALPALTEILNEIGETISAIGQAMTGARGDITQTPNQKNALAQRLTVARQLASTLAEPVTQIKALGSGFASKLHLVDEGVRTIIMSAPDEIETDPASADHFQTFFGTIRELVIQADSGLGSVQGMIDALGPLEKVSRDLRPPLRILREGLTFLMDGRETMRAWIPLLEQTPPEPVQE